MAFSQSIMTARTLCALCNRSTLSVFFKSCNRQISCAHIVMGTSPGQFKDQQNAALKKAQKVSQFVRLARGAVNREGGISDPTRNKALASLLHQCQKEGVPKGVILNALSTKSLDKEVTYLLTGADDLAILLGCRVYNPVHAKMTLNRALKFSLFNVKKADMKLVGNYFEYKGILFIPQPFEDGKVLSEEESTELAIDVEAEDVMKSENGLTFLCDSSNLKSVLAAFNERKVPVSYSSIDHVPINKVEITSEDETSYQAFIKLLQVKTNVVEKSCDFYVIASNFQSD